MTALAQKNDAKDQARAQLNGIIEMMDAYETAQGNGFAWHEGCKQDEETMRQIIMENALSIEGRSGWYCPGDYDSQASQIIEYKILLCTGGPAVQIVGDLGDDFIPAGALLQHQDWYTPWEDYIDTTEKEDSVLLEYVSFYWFGE